MESQRLQRFLGTLWHDLGGRPGITSTLQLTDPGDLPSVFAVSDFAAAAVAAAGAAVAELLSPPIPRLIVSKRLASLWFGWSIRPDGWKMPAPWDPIAGDYAASDGWIRLHTNAPHHRAAALAVLETGATKDEVGRAVAGWKASELESAVVERGGCAAALKTTREWQEHPQGRAVSAEPTVAIRETDDASPSRWVPSPVRPLGGLKVLDLTRVLAGPVATRFLAGFGAEVLRIDPPAWDEPGVIPEVTLGKRCARLDLRDTAARSQFTQLLAAADVLVHGYRADALEGLGFGTEVRRKIRPGLIDVSLNAYGWSGPWRNRRGFDSLVQMSSGIAAAGMHLLQKDRPTPLPVQALDHVAGYVMAAAVIRGLTQRLRTGKGFEARTSLARTAQLLIDGETGTRPDELQPAADADYSPSQEMTGFGPALRLRSPLQVGSTALHWDRPAAQLGSSPPVWT